MGPADANDGSPEEVETPKRALAGWGRPQSAWSSRDSKVGKSRSGRVSRNYLNAHTELRIQASSSSWTDDILNRELLESVLGREELRNMEKDGGISLLYSLDSEPSGFNVCL